MDFNTATKVEGALDRAHRAASIIGSPESARLLEAERVMQEARVFLGNVETGTDINTAGSRLLSFLLGCDCHVTAHSIGFNDLDAIRRRNARVR